MLDQVVRWLQVVPEDRVIVGSLHLLLRGMEGHGSDVIHLVVIDLQQDLFRSLIIPDDAEAILVELPRGYMRRRGHLFLTDAQSPHPFQGQYPCLAMIQVFANQIPSVLEHPDEARDYLVGEYLSFRIVGSIIEANRSP